MHRSVHRFYSTQPRLNPLRIQMLSPSLHQQIFPFTRNRVKPEAIDIAQRHLSRQKLDIHATPLVPEIDLQVPRLEGENIREHFYRMAVYEAREHLPLAQELASGVVPPMPNEEALLWREGWTFYDSNGGNSAVEYPQEQAMVFDVETCVSSSQCPVMAVAVSLSGWYVWLSPVFFQGKHSLLPMPDQQRPRILVGHHVTYDRARIQQEYTIHGTQTQFIDTLSLHCAVSGLSGQQRPQWQMYRKKKELQEEDEPEHCEPNEEETLTNDHASKWAEVGAMNSLKEVVRLHLNERLDKTARDIFVTGNLEEIQEQWQSLVMYCAKDVEVTHRLYCQLWPKFQEKCPHPATFHGMTAMASGVLPVTDRWLSFLRNCDKQYKEALERADDILVQIVYDTLNQVEKEPSLKETDIWLQKLDWTPRPARYTKEKRKKDGTFAANGEPRPIGDVFLFGKPQWFLDLWCSKARRPIITPRSRIVPYLLKMNWQQHPFHFLTLSGWCFGVKRNEVEIRKKYEKITQENKTTSTNVLEDPLYPDWVFFRIPHHSQEGANVGNVFTRNYARYYEDGTLNAAHPAAKDILQVNAMFSFWIGYQKRCKNQFIVWDDKSGDSTALWEEGEQAPFLKTLDGKAADPEQRLGLLLPQIIPMGTVTRRAVEPTWMTASNSKKTLVGSEMKSRIQAPADYLFVGADVDSQELWLSAILGDAQFGLHGATALGWMNLQGTKADGTDLHSRTASILGMNRNDAKVFNYGRIYGAGVRFATQLLQRFNRQMTADEAKQRAHALYEATKGTESRMHRLYSGGSESFMFTMLERVATDKRPMTPGLHCTVSDALMPQNVDREFMTSRVNWTIQSSGVDYLHLLLLSMRYLCRRFSIRARLALTIHDEVRFLVHQEDTMRAALALQISNLWTRALFAYNLQMPDLPQSVAFFSAVDFDTVLRKEVDMPCTTPSSPDPIPNGKSAIIETIIKESGSLVAHHKDPLQRPKEYDEIMTKPLPLPPWLTDYAFVQQMKQIPNYIELLSLQDHLPPLQRNGPKSGGTFMKRKESNSPSETASKVPSDVAAQQSSSPHPVHEHQRRAMPFKVSVTGAS